MKKHVNYWRTKALASAIVLSMAAAPAIPAMAADTTTPTTTLKVTGIESGCEVYAYAIALDATDTNGNHYWKYNTVGTVEDKVKDGDISTDDLIYFYTHLNTGSGWDANDGNGDAVVDSKVITLTYNEADGSYSAAGVGPGLYVIAANKETKEYTYSGNVVPVNYKYDATGVAAIDDTDGVITVGVKKSDEPTIEKAVVENETDSKHGDANIGDTVNFKISVTVPDYTGSWKTDNLHFIITDSVTEGLTLDTDSIKIAEKDGEGTAISDVFGTNKKTETTNTKTDTTGFTLDLYGEDVYQYAGKTVEITYQAEVNDKASVNFDDEENKASIRFSTTANSTDLSNPETDTTHHYTFGIDTLVNGTDSEKTTELTKFGVRTTKETNNKVALSGAEFQLRDSAGDLLYFTEDGQLTTDKTEGTNHIVSGSGGELVATGLDAGTYKLTESKAPLGYALDKTEYTITITPTYDESDGTLTSYAVKINGGTNEEITFTHEMQDNGTISNTDNSGDTDTFAVNNTPLITLPETGAAGVIALSFTAVAMMAGFGSVYLVLRKKNHNA